MSRVKKNKIEKRQKIKETIIGLSLAISIGVAGSAGSYAYFSDRVNTDNGIKITMGTLDVGIGEGFNQDEFEIYDETKPGTLYTKDFNITNTGTLDEILTLRFDKVLFNGNTEDLAKIKYTLKIGDNEPITCTLATLLQQGVKIGRLNSGDSISCKATLQNEGIAPSYEENIEIGFDLVVEGVQINHESVQSGGAN